MEDRKRLKDDLFELLLKQAAKEYSEQELDQAIVQFSDAPEIEYSKDYKEKMCKLITSEKHKEHWIQWKRPLKKVAVIIVACFVSLVAVTMCVEAFRMKFFNFIFSGKAEYSTLTTIEQDQEFQKSDIPAGWSHVYLPAYLPEGFHLSGVQSTRKLLYVTYTNQQQHTIMLEQSNDAKRKMVIDTEDSVESEFDLGEKKAIANVKDGENVLLWENDDYSFYLTSESVSGTDLSEIARSMEKIIK